MITLRQSPTGTVSFLLLSSVLLMILILIRIMTGHIYRFCNSNNRHNLISGHPAREAFLLPCRSQAVQSSSGGENIIYHTNKHKEDKSPSVSATARLWRDTAESGCSRFHVGKGVLGGRVRGATVGKGVLGTKKVGAGEVRM